MGEQTVVKLHPLAQKVADLLEPHIERQGFELVAVEYRPGARSSLLRLLVDKPGGGIGLDELERLSPVMSDLLDVYDPVEGRYTLELASPGINRPLAKLSHFRAFLGRRVRIRTHRARDGRRVFLGMLRSVSPEGVELDDELTKEPQRIDFEEIQVANYEHEFG